MTHRLRKREAARLDRAPGAAPYRPMFDRRIFCLAATACLAAPRILRADTAALGAAIAGLDQLHSLQVMVGGALAFAEAPRGPGLERLAPIKSCSKSLVGLLLGTAIQRGEIASVDATIGEVAPRLLPKNADPAVSGITMEDLVTLRAGLERTSGANYGAWIASGNWVADALSRPLVARPGSRMLYSTGTTHILGAALAEASGRSLLALARERLGGPMGIEIPAWTRDPQGYYLGGNEMALRPTAMLKVAQLVLDEGRVGGSEVIAPEWISASMQVRTRSPWSGLGYGYGWFLSPSGYVLGRGYGGQIIAAHPARRLAVAITSDPARPARSEGYFGDLMRLLDGPILAMG